LRDEQLGVVEARARVAYPLAEAEKAGLVEALKKMSGKDIRLHVDVEPGLVGGLVVRIGDTVYDGSVRHQLASLRERLEDGSYAANGTGVS
jgi:F-type H+-transporting ATPase subunit delta